MLTPSSRAAHGAPVLTLIAVFATLVAAGCGGGGGRDEAGIIPTKAAVVVQFSLDATANGSWAQTRAALRRVPSFGLVENQIPGPQQALDQLLLVPGGKVNLNWAKDVKPWLGKHGGAAVWLEDVNDDDRPVGFITWLETDDEQAAAQALTRSLGTPTTSTHDDVTVNRGTKRTDDVFWAIFDGRVVLASDKASLAAAIDAHAGTSLEDRDDWAQLTRQRKGVGQPLVSVIATRNLWSQAEDALDEIDNDELTREQRNQFRSAIEQGQQRARAFAVHAGARKSGLWIDAVVVGDGKVHTSDDGASMQLLGRLPQTSLVAAATTSGAKIDAEQAAQLRKQLAAGRKQMQAMLELNDSMNDVVDATAGTQPGHASPTGDFRWVMGLFSLGEQLLSDELVEQVRDGYTGTGAGALIADRDQLAVVSTAGVQDQDAAQAAATSFEELFADYLAKYTPVRIAFAGQDARNFIISGIPAKRLMAMATASAGDSAAKVRSNPLVREFVQPTLTGVYSTGEDEQLFAFPSWAIGPLERALADGDGAGDDGAQLADSKVFKRDMAAVDPPDDAVGIVWFDLAGLAKTIGEPIDGRVSFVIVGQLEHIGGPVIWSTTSRIDDDTVTRAVVEVPLYE